MMRMFLTACFALLALPALPALADIDAVIDDHIITRHATFAESTAALVEVAQTDCRPASVIPAYHAAFDAWVGISHIRFGPLETSGEVLAIAFWPDKKGKIRKILTRMIKDEAPVIFDAKAFSTYSVAARGFFALEQMLFDPAFSAYDTDSYSCALIQAITVDLARISAHIHAGWADSFATILRTAGAPGNEVFLSEHEGAQALFTNMLAGLEFVQGLRIARPLGSLERPRPLRAEARRSGRSLRNIIVSLEAIEEMAGMLSGGQASKSMDLFASTLEFSHSLEAQVFTRLEEESAQSQLGALQRKVILLHHITASEIGAHLGVAAGFNAMDGD